MVTAPTRAKLKVIVMTDPAASGLLSPVSTTWGTGPVRSTGICAGRLTAPPAIRTSGAVPGALIETSRSPSCDVTEKNTPARGTATPVEDASTYALSIEMPSWVA